MSCTRIRDWINEYGEDGVYISFSGGKDSTVLMDLVRNQCGYKDVKAMFVDIPTQFPELRRFVEKYENVDIVTPKYNFFEVCEKYGFPLISKEAAECVYGARKYLASLQNDGIIPTGEQTGSDLKKRPYSSSYRKLCGVGEYSKPKKNEQSGGANQRLAQVMGWLTQDGTIKANIPSENRSKFSQTKYKFFLNANFEISNQCCQFLKKYPAQKYGRETGRKPITAQMASESNLRLQKWLQHGCNVYDSAKPRSNPMSFWTEQDVLQYLFENNIEICSVYGDIIKSEDGVCSTTGCARTGCELCGFGAHLEGSPSRFEKLRVTHPKMYGLLDIIQNSGVTYREAINWINDNSDVKIPL